MFWKKQVFSGGDGSAYVSAGDKEALSRWYREHLGFSYSALVDAPEGSYIELGYSAIEVHISVGQASKEEMTASRVPPPILFAKKVDAAWEYLVSHGVAPGPIQQDSGGIRFFRFRDPDGNKVEVCQDH